MVTVWAEKEMRNLSRMYSVGIPVPSPKIVKQNVLLMDFIGADGWPAPLLKVGFQVLLRVLWWSLPLIFPGNRITLAVLGCRNFSKSC